MKRVKFLNNPRSYNPDNTFVAHISGISSKQELFKQLNDKLEFPDYFGFNWDALSDCLRDFNWIEQQGIVLVHDDFPELDKPELETYLQVLVEAVQDWKEGEEHFLEIIFSERLKDLISQYIL